MDYPASDSSDGGGADTTTFSELQVFNLTAIVKYGMVPLSSGPGGETSDLGIGMRIRGKQIVSRRVKVMLRAGGMIAGIGRVMTPSGHPLRMRPQSFSSWPQ
jgi:hypothetical protein